MTLIGMYRVNQLHTGMVCCRLLTGWVVVTTALFAGTGCGQKIKIDNIIFAVA